MYISGIGGGAPTAWTDMSAGMDQLHHYVKSGGLTMTQEAADDLKKGVEDLKSMFEEVLSDGAVISRRPDIGSSPVCEGLKDFFSSIATDDPQGLLPNVQKMHDKSGQIIDDIDACVRDIKSTDDGGAHGLRQQMGD